MRIFLILLALIFTFFIGAAVNWMHSYALNNDHPFDDQLFSKVLGHSTVPIPDENYSCEGDRKDTVAEVVASILAQNAFYTRNRMSLGCYDLECAFSINHCPPWKSSECGSRILRFTLDDSRDVKPDSFICLDVP